MTPTATRQRPRLLFFHSPRSGRCRRAEGFLAQVLQHCHNHDTFHLTRISVDRRPDLAQRFQIDILPTLLVVESSKVTARLAAPRGCGEIRSFLHPWLRTAAETNAAARAHATPTPSD